PPHSTPRRPHPPRRHPRPHPRHRRDRRRAPPPPHRPPNRHRPLPHQRAARPPTPRGQTLLTRLAGSDPPNAVRTNAHFFHRPSPPRRTSNVVLAGGAEGAAALDGFGAVADAELAVDRGDVVLDRVR